MPTNPLAQDLGGVVRLFHETSGDTWAARGARVVSDPEFPVLRGHVADCVEDDDAAFIAACHEFFRTHSAEIAGALEQLRDLHDSIRTVYDAVPILPITADTIDAATDALHAFCLLVGIHKVDIDTPREEAARSATGGATLGEPQSS